MARSGMTDILAFTRMLIQDETTPYDLSDDTVQSVLDDHSELASYSLLTPINYVQSSGGFTQATADTGWWESSNSPTDDTSVVLKRLTDDVEVTPDSSDLRRGVFVFASAQQEPVYISRGYSYDVYAAASQCLHLLVAKIRSEYSFSTDEGSFQRQQRVETLLDLAKQYAMRQRVRPLSNDLGESPNTVWRVCK